MAGERHPPCILDCDQYPYYVTTRDLAFLHLPRDSTSGAVLTAIARLRLQCNVPAILHAPVRLPIVDNVPGYVEENGDWRLPGGEEQEEQEEGPPRRNDDEEEEPGPVTAVSATVSSPTPHEVVLPVLVEATTAAPDTEEPSSEPIDLVEATTVAPDTEEPGSEPIDLDAETPSPMDLM